MTDFDIDITAEAPEPLTVNLVGKTYRMRPPKAALGLALTRAAAGRKGQKSDLETMLQSIQTWLEHGFGKKHAGEIMQRLEDADDLLDIEHIVRLVQVVVERAAGNPSTS